MWIARIGTLLGELGRIHGGRLETIAVYRGRSGRFVVHRDRAPQRGAWSPGGWRGYLGLGDQSWTFVEGGSTVEVVETLAGYGIEAGTRKGAPGVYVGERKIASLGLRVRRGCSYHGLAFNVAMDLEPFARINPCGFEAGVMTSMAEELGAGLAMADVKHRLAVELAGCLGRRLA